MLSVVYLYVKIRYISTIEKEEDLKNLLFEMNVVHHDQEYISDIILDDENKNIILEVSRDGYEYIKNKNLKTIKIEVKKVVYHLNSYHKFKNQ